MASKIDSPLLRTLGSRVRQQRSALALTLRELAEQASVSQRFLVSLEAGDANISVLRLDQVARALNTSASALLQQPERRATTQKLVALLGLRGAGKTALGQRAAPRLSVPFVELDALVASRAGMTLEGVFSLHGADYYRRLEQQEVTTLLGKNSGGILATGGSIVTNHKCYGQLKRSCVTVFLKASAEDHWNRVVAQGDVRPMADRHDALEELRTILRARRALYEQADHIIDTSALGLERSVDAVVRIAREAM